MTFHLHAQGFDASTQSNDPYPSRAETSVQQNGELESWKTYLFQLSTAYCHEKQSLGQLQQAFNALQTQFWQACAAQAHLRAELDNAQSENKITKAMLDEERLEHGTALEDLSWQEYRTLESESDADNLCKALQLCRQIAEDSLSSLTSFKGRSFKEPGTLSHIGSERPSTVKDIAELLKPLLDENSMLQRRVMEQEKLLAQKAQGNNTDTAIQADVPRTEKNSSSVRRRRGGKRRGGKNGKRS